MELASSSARVFPSARFSEFDLQHVGGRKLGSSRSCPGILRAGVIRSFRAGSKGFCEQSSATNLGAELSLHRSLSRSDLSLRSSPGLGFLLRSRSKSRFLCSNGGFVGAMDANASPEDLGHSEEVVDDELQGWEKRVEKFGESLSSAFPLWVGLACIYALKFPGSMAWINGPIQVWLIDITMLGMGMTLTLKDFQSAFAMPKELFAGILLQYTVMPTAGYAVSRMLNLPPHYAAGLILVACCPGGTASNIVTYLARGNVALSVLMTAASTFLAVIMTPLLTAKLVGQYINVDAAALFASTVQVVLLPVMGGAVLNYFFHRVAKKISLVSPTIAVFIVALLVAGSVARSSTVILSSAGPVLLAVLLLHGTGFAWGYILARLLGIDESSSRTISIEVGMQNSVLGVVLAGQHFSSPLTAVPCAVSSVCHSLIGSSLARFWRDRPTAPTE